MTAPKELLEQLLVNPYLNYYEKLYLRQVLQDALSALQQPSAVSLPCLQRHLQWQLDLQDVLAREDYGWHDFLESMLMTLHNAEDAAERFCPVWLECSSEAMEVEELLCTSRDSAMQRLHKEGLIARKRGLYGAAPAARWPALERRNASSDDEDGDEGFAYDSGYCPEEVRQAAEATAVAAREAQVAAQGGPAVDDDEDESEEEDDDEDEEDNEAVKAAEAASSAAAARGDFYAAAAADALAHDERLKQERQRLQDKAGSDTPGSDATDDDTSGDDTRGDVTPGGVTPGRHPAAAANRAPSAPAATPASGPANPDPKAVGPPSGWTPEFVPVKKEAPPSRSQLASQATETRRLLESIIFERRFGRATFKQIIATMPATQLTAYHKIVLGDMWTVLNRHVHYQGAVNQHTPGRILRLELQQLRSFQAWLHFHLPHLVGNEDGRHVSCSPLARQVAEVCSAMLRHLALCDTSVEVASMQLQLQYGSDQPLNADTSVLDRCLKQLIGDGLVSVHNSKRIHMAIPRPVVARHDPVVARQMGW